VRRFALIQLVPSVAIPAAGIAAAASIGAVTGLIGVCYFFILLGSMTVNGWLHTREPRVLVEGRVAWGQAAAVLSVTVLAAATLAAMLVESTDRSSEFPTTLVLGALTAAVSVVSWAFAISAARALPPNAPSPPPRAWSEQVARWGTWVGALVLAIAAGATAVTIALPGQTWASPAMIVLLVIGLPWAHPTVLFMMFLGLIASTIDGTTGLPQYVLAVPLFIAAAANGVGAWWTTRTAMRWHRLQTWYFRLARLATAS
jgi:hypothetical protein